MRETIINVKNVDKYFDDDSVLRDVSFEIFRGEFLCLVGPSGCGKSTLLRLLLGFEKTNRGRIIFSQEVEKALVFQNFALFPWLSVEDNIGFGLKMSGKSTQTIGKKVDEVIKDLGLSGSEKLHPKELSGGMKQRVGLGRALVMDPDILFLDEPFSAVDAFTARDLRKKLLEIWQKRNLTVVMVTHLIEEAVELADRVVVLGNDKTKNSVMTIHENHLNRPRNNRSQEFFNEVDKLESHIH